MIPYIIHGSSAATTAVGILFAFFLTLFSLIKLQKFLPKDIGREFAHDGKLSAGKPRGAGLLFILAFMIATLLFAVMNLEAAIYLLLVAAAMLTGYLDDKSKKPWNEYKKGVLDLLISLGVAVSYLYYNSNTIILFPGYTVTLHPVILAVILIVLVWISINVTNCSDGVDGLSGSLTIITLMTLYFVGSSFHTDQTFSYMILLFVICILAYLWFNATPSSLMMGDAGSRAMGLFISLAVLKTGAPLLFIPVAFVLLVDGGLGLLKVFLIRFLNIRILKKVRTPIHDQVRKVWGWSNTQTVFRFSIIQLLISALLLSLLR